MKDEKMLVNVVVNRHQLDSRYAQLVQVTNYGRRGKPGVCATQLFGYVRMEACEALDVDFIRLRIVPGYSRWTVLAPAERRLNDASQRREWSAVTFIDICAAPVAATKTVERVVPAHVAADGFRVRIEYDLVWIESVAFPRRVRAVGSITV